jgi:hypothetical protein
MRNERAGLWKQLDSRHKPVIRVPYYCYGIPINCNCFFQSNQPLQQDMYLESELMRSERAGIGGQGQQQPMGQETTGMIITDFIDVSSLVLVKISVRGDSTPLWKQ